MSILCTCTLLVKVIFFPAGKNECQLYCWSENEPQPYRVVTSIASGTPCKTKTGQRGVCLETLCTVSLSTIK